MKKHLRLAALLATTILVLSSCSTQKQVRLVLLPDIQTYSRLYPDILRSQTQWAVEHADSIDFVLQQGDMTDHNIDKEWAVAASTLIEVRASRMALRDTSRNLPSATSLYLKYETTRGTA